MMSEFLPKEVREGLAAAQVAGAKAHTRATVVAGGVTVPLLSVRDGGFSVAAADAPQLRGFVDLFEGEAHVSHCLIVAAQLDGDTWVYDIKRQTPIGQPPTVDFVRSGEAPVALIESDAAR